MLEQYDGYKRHIVTLNDVSMAYVDTGSGEPILFLHGNPTSSFIWRNILPSLETRGRCIAPDLVGMGESGKIPDAGQDTYTFADHRTYLFGLLDALDLEGPVTLVLHDWGAALGLAWARQNENMIKGIALMEPLLMPMTWDMMPDAAVDAFRAFRTPGSGEDMCLTYNFFVEQVIPMAVLRELTQSEMAAYCAPYLEPGESRRPTLTWPRQIPLDGDPADVAAELEANCDWLRQSTVKKLFIKGEPGMMVGDKVLAFCRSLANLTEISVAGAYYVQEDSPAEISQALADWIV